MAKRVTINVDFLGYESGVPTNDPSDLIKLSKPVEDEEVAEMARHMMRVDPGGNVESVPFDGAGAGYVMIFSDQTVTLALNDSDTTFDLKPKTAGEKSPVFFNRGLITKLVLTNVSAQIANLDVILVALP